jgi:hypothetical protein
LGTRAEGYTEVSPASALLTDYVLSVTSSDIPDHKVGDIADQTIKAP